MKSLFLPRRAQHLALWSGSRATWRRGGGEGGFLAMIGEMPTVIRQCLLFVDLRGNLKVALFSDAFNSWSEY